MQALQAIGFVRPHFRKSDFSHSLALEPTAYSFGSAVLRLRFRRRLTASVGLYQIRSDLSLCRLRSTRAEKGMTMQCKTVRRIVLLALVILMAPLAAHPQ